MRPNGRSERPSIGALDNGSKSLQLPIAQKGKKSLQLPVFESLQLPGSSAVGHCIPECQHATRAPCRERPSDPG